MSGPDWWVIVEADYGVSREELRSQQKALMSIAVLLVLVFAVAFGAFWATFVGYQERKVARHFEQLAEEIEKQRRLLDRINNTISDYIVLKDLQGRYRYVNPAFAVAVGRSPEELVGLDNEGVGTAQNDAYALLAVSPNIPEGGAGGQSPTPDIRAVGINTIPVPPGFCSGQSSFLWVFAINTWERQEHLVPVSHQISLDTDQDGNDDYLVLNRDVSLNNVTDGRQLTWVVDLNTGSAGAFFFAEHSTNTGNTVLIICGEQIGLSGPDILATNVDVTSVFAQDFYYGGLGDEAVFPNTLTVTPLGEQYFALPNDVSGKTYDAAGLPIYDFGPWPGNTPEVGVMLIGNGDRGAGARGGATQATEALLFTPE